MTEKPDFITSEASEKDDEPFEQIATGPQIPLKTDWPKHHEFLFQNKEQKTAPVELVKDVRSDIDDMGGLKGTFSVKNLSVSMRLFPNDPSKSEAIRNIMWFIGTWQVPEYLSNDSKRRWVNPNGVHAHTYPATNVKCKCGANLATPASEDHPGKAVTDPQHHSDDCQQRWKLRAQARFYDQREAILRYGLYLDHSARDLANQLGITKDHVSKLAQKVGVDGQRLREEARDRRARTAAVLLWEYPVSDIAAAYGMSTGGIRNAIYDRTDVDIAERNEKRESDQ